MTTTIKTPHPEKLQFLNKDLTTKINDGTEDLLRMTNFWTWWTQFRSNQSLLKSLHHSRTSLYGKLYFLKEDFEKNAQLYLENNKKFMRLTAVDGDDTVLDIEEQKQQIEARTELHRTYCEQKADYIAGNKAKGNMLVSDSEVNMMEAEHVKSNDYLDAVKKSNSEVKTYPSKPNLEFDQFDTTLLEISLKNDLQKENLVETTESQPLEKPKAKQVITTNTGEMPDYFVVEEQLEECMKLAGEKFASQFSNQQEQNANSVTLSTTSKNVLKQATYKQNILSHIGLDKIIWAGIVYCIALAGEILIFSAIFGLVFNFSPVKSIITGTAPVLISFVLGIALYGTILNFIKSNNQIALKIIRSSRFMLLVISLGLVYAFCMGLLYKNSLDQDDLRSQISMLTQEQYVYNEDVVNDDMTQQEKENAIRENGTKVNEVNTKLIDLQEGPMATIVKLTVAFSSLIFMLFSGIMFGVLLLFLSTYKIQKKIKAIQNRLPRTEAEFNSQKTVISEVETLSNRILNWMGQLRFIEKMLAGESSRELLFNPKTEQNKPSFSSNGTYHNEHPINL